MLGRDCLPYNLPNVVYGNAGHTWVAGDRALGAQATGARHGLTQNCVRLAERIPMPRVAIGTLNHNAGDTDRGSQVTGACIETNQQAALAQQGGRSRNRKLASGI
jgi:hypothetical protein